MHVVVTGGAGVLGQAVSTAFLEAGWRVSSIDLASTAGEFAGFTALGGVDLADPAACAAAFQRASAENGAISAVMAVAGGFVWRRFEDANWADWSRMLDINLKTSVNAVTAALPHLTGPAPRSITLIGALAAQRGAAGFAPYAASKAGVARLAEVLAEELADRGVRVNALLPSILDTPANRADMPDQSPAAWVSPAAVADAAIFLASDRARAITGALIPVTAGQRDVAS